MNPYFGGLVAIIIGFFVALFSFFKPKSIVVVGVFLIAVAMIVVFGFVCVELVAVVIIASLFCLYAVFTCLALHTTYSCLLDLEKYLERQAETKDCDIRLLESNTDKERKEREKTRQECENNEKKARENYEEEKGKLSYCLLMVMISVILCVVFSVIDNPNVLEHKPAKKMTSDQNSNMECLGLTIENPKPKDSKDDTKK
ncbi:hypothetical protein [Helicobacter pylori]|uniref:hypothetical protein n=1 Tax=Helicobacter pylori TaxID=210 RepID=UPI00165BA642|nr:hypothetical protein [Helicobacter pylori]WQS30243.1 hypothetical protein KVE56_00870 [Helicobacter pylori]